jgi:hypothetical protein
VVSGGKSSVIRATQHHPFWDETSKTWVDADQLKPGDALLSANGATATVASTVVVPGAHDMWDLTVQDDHDFYITLAAETTTVLVHNCPTPADDAELPSLSASTSKLQHTYSEHASDFGYSGNWNKATGESFEDTLSEHIDDPDTSRIVGTYRGDPVIHNVNPATGLDVIQSPSGGLISGWRLNSQQLSNVLTRGSL